MYDEDRQTALAMYGRMFDEAADEAGLLELLVSPTRQAVVLARSYDAKARKTQIEQSESADFSDPDSVPAFIFIIDKTAQQALELGVKEANPVEGQFSIFDELPELEETLPAAETEAENAVEAVETVEEVPAEAEAVQEPAAIPVPLPELHEEAQVQDEAEDAERSDVDDTADAVDAFLKDFTIENGELISLKAEDAAQEAPAEAEPVSDAAEATVAVDAPEAEKPVEKRVKTNILLLILYIFLAIPLGAVGVALLLIPTVFFMALGSCCGYVGVYAISTSFASFAVIADTMAVFGAGLALLALALFFIWVFVWFLGGAIVGYIRALCVLGRKLCCKEVEQQ